MAPRTEDWGWYIRVNGHGASYLVGASGQPEGPAPDMDWTVQIHKNRSLVERITGRNKMTSADRLSAVLEKAMRSQPDFGDVEVDRSA